MMTPTHTALEEREGHRNELENVFINPLRVLAEYDATYQTHVAYCLETGNVVTANNSEDLKLMMKELLEDEVSFAIKHKNLTNLFSNPASYDIFVKWQRALENGKVEDIPLDLENPVRPKGPGGADRRATFIRVIAA
jgi:hypothetical protein